MYSLQVLLQAVISLSPIKRKSIMASEHTIVGDNLLLDQTTQSLFRQVFTTGKEIEPKHNVFTQYNLVTVAHSLL